jgi:hypothetical protein
MKFCLPAGRQGSTCTCRFERDVEEKACPYIKKKTGRLSTLRLLALNLHQRGSGQDAGASLLLDGSRWTNTVSFNSIQGSHLSDEFLVNLFTWEDRDQQGWVSKRKIFILSNNQILLLL